MTKPDQIREVAMTSVFEGTYLVRGRGGRGVTLYTTHDLSGEPQEQNLLV